MSKMDEIILVAPRKEVFDNEKLTFQGVLTDNQQTAAIVENMSNTYRTMRRGDAEENTNYKQPIPYVAIKRGNEVFTYKRLQAGGEKRLHDQISIGVGGHVNDIEGLNFLEVISESLKRELEEELFIDISKLTLNTVGLINDDENAVGRVHIGMLVIGEVEEDVEVSVRETDQLEGKWMTVEELKSPEVYETLETWSQFVVDTL